MACWGATIRTIEPIEHEFGLLAMDRIRCNCLAQERKIRSAKLVTFVRMSTRARAVHLRAGARTRWASNPLAWVSRLMGRLLPLPNERSVA